jgi:hypothetical protein
MDTVIFTGQIPEHELKHERPIEYARLVERGQLAALETTAPAPAAVLFGRILGSIGLVLGLITIGLIIFSAIV